MKRHHNSRSTLLEEKEIVRIYTTNTYASMQAVGNMCGFSRHTIKSVLLANGVEIRPREVAQRREPGILTEKDTARFIKNIELDANGCWNWVGKSKFEGGYGCIHLLGHRTGAHRAAWMLYRGAIPSGMCVCHSCDNPNCCNPEHLFLGTHADNMKDRNKKGRARGGSSKGMENPMAKLSDDDIRLIKISYRTGTTQRSLAADFGVTQGHISGVISGRYRSDINV